jgi:isocitrate/isopropylmalate dehydrogenase
MSARDAKEGLLAVSQTKRELTIGVIPGDGIGRDVTRAARIVLERINSVESGLHMSFLDMQAGEVPAKETGNPLPEETRKGIQRCDAVLFGAVGAPHDFAVLSGIRYGLHLYANVRPIKALPGVDVLQPNADLVVIRENTEGLYRGVGYSDGDYHVNLRIFTQLGMERIIRFAFDYARREGRQKVTFTHKESVLAHTDAVMKRLFYELAESYPDVEAADMEIDACAMRMIMKPETLDVIIAENANGDILSDVGGGLIGGLGFTASANIGEKLAVFEPIHGSAPKHADKNEVNPIAALMACRMMFDYLERDDIARRLEQAIGAVLSEGRVRTYDIGGSSSTTDVAEAIADQLENRTRESR